MKQNTGLILCTGLLVFLGCAPQNPEQDGGAKPDVNNTFTDISQSSGLNFVHEPGVEGNYYMPENLGSGGAFFDYDQDGDLDIYLINGAFRNRSTVVKNRLFRQEPGGKFVDVTVESGLGDCGYGMGCAVGDIDNDGDLDLYLSNYGADQLFCNQGDGTFQNITAEAGIHNPGWGSSVTFLDFDRDNYLDIYVANYLKYDSTVTCTDQAGRPDYCGPGGFPGEADRLYRNNGAGKFIDVSERAGITGFPGKSLGVVSLDLNGDHYMDIYVSNDGEANQLWISQKDGTFQDQALLLGVALNQIGYMEAGMGIAVGDVDNDQRVDLFITHLRGETNTLYRNAGDYGFSDETNERYLAGVSVSYTGFGTGFLDFDHDGDLDLAVVNGRVTRGPLLTGRRPATFWDFYAEPNLLFENTGRGEFRPIFAESPFCATVENSRGLAVGDVDNDGDMDLLVMNEGGPARLYRNDLPQKGNWLLVRAVDPLLQRDMIGAQITVVAGEQRQVRHVISGYSYLSASDLRVHFGLGPHPRVDRIEVRWPDGALEVFPGTPANQIIELQKGRGRSDG